MKRKLANLFGAIGYLFLLMQWMWALVIGLLPIVTQPAVHDLFMPQSQPVVDRPVASREPLPGPVQMIVILAAIGFSVGIVIYALVSVPRAVGRTGQKFTRTVAAKTVPSITHHKKISKKRERRLIEQITCTIKALAVIIPLPVLAIPPHEIINLDHMVSVAFGIILASFTAICFAVQFLLAKIWRIDGRLVW